MARANATVCLTALMAPAPPGNARDCGRHYISRGASDVPSTATHERGRPMKPLMAALACVTMMSGSASAQDLPARWDELTASDWPRALEKSARTAVLPIGILEKHGPHAQIGSDLIQAREIAARATTTG